MFQKRFPNVLTSNKVRSTKHEDNTGKLEKIKFKEFKKSEKTMQRIKEAGLENEIDDCIEVEDCYKIKKIVGYGATSVVYKAYRQIAK